MHKTFKKILAVAIFALSLFMTGTQSAYADGEFQVSPMNQKISLVPGERTYGTFKITNPATNSYKFNFELSVVPFTVNENYEIKFANNGDYTLPVLRTAAATRVSALFLPAARAFAFRQSWLIPSAPSFRTSAGRGAFFNTIIPVFVPGFLYTSRYSGK